MHRVVTLVTDVYFAVKSLQQPTNLRVFYSTLLRHWKSYVFLKVSTVKVPKS